MKVRSYLIYILLFFGFAPYCLMAQQRTEIENEAWTSINKNWNIYLEGNKEGYISSFYLDFSNFFNTKRIPNEYISLVEQLDKTNKKFIVSLTPLHLIINGQMTIVYYSFVVITKNPSGEKTYNTGKRRDILLKQGKEWVMIDPFTTPST